MVVQKLIELFDKAGIVVNKNNFLSTPSPDLVWYVPEYRYIIHLFSLEVKLDEPSNNFGLKLQITL
ncbi:MAG: hypothetical protein ACXAEU_02875 [Candidatus Hodarchaeales archaeon]